METFQIKIINESGKKELFSVIHDPNLGNRTGYNAHFLGIELKLPTLDSASQNNIFLEEIAENEQESQNGREYLDYTNYSVMFNKVKKLPFFTAVNIVGDTNELAIIHEARGSDKWFQDDRIKINGDFFQFSNNDYKLSGFQKGHMVRFYDPAWGADQVSRKTAMGDTFYFTNCCPQLGKYNAGIWNDLEDYYMARAIFQDNKVTVFTGPIFKNAMQRGKLLVPINFWKIIVYTMNNQMEALGFLISHKIANQDVMAKSSAFLADNMVNPTLKKKDIDRLFNDKNLKKWVVKIDLLEEKTGLKFNLNDVDINKNETKYFNIESDELKDDMDKLKFMMDFKPFKASLNVNKNEEYLKNI